jgi:hypothetical protein
MWTKENRVLYQRDGLRYPTDLTEAEWAEVSPLIPPARFGGPRLFRPLEPRRYR